MSVPLRFKLLLLGDGAVGKTTLIKRFIKGTFRSDYKMTVGVDVFTKNVNLGPEQNLVTFTIFDIAGQQRFEVVRTAFYKGATGALIVFDLTRNHTFRNVEKWVKELRIFAGSIPFIIIGNKSDLKEFRLIRDSEINSLTDELSSQYIETSAKTGEHVEEAFHKLAKLCWNRLDDKIKQYLKEGEIIKEEVEFDKNLIIEKVSKILTSTVAVNEFRFLIAGNEEVQKPFLKHLFQVETISWPPEDLNILYATTDYKFKSGMKDYNLEIYILSNLNELKKKQTLFLDTCRQADALITFFNIKDQKEIENTIDTCIKIREKLPELEIVLIGDFTNSISFPIKERKMLKDDHNIITADDFFDATNKILRPLLFKREDREYEAEELRELVDNLKDYIVNPRNIKNAKIKFLELLKDFGVSTEELTRSLSADEQDWRKQIYNIYFFIPTGTCIYDQSFQAATGISPNLVAGGLTGISHLMQEVTQKETKVKIIEQEDVIVLLEHSKYVSAALVAKENLITLRNKLKDVVQEVEEFFKEELENFKGKITPFLKISKFVNKIFEE
ncbi:MAG: GTP-binding protein [Candidatus Hodarchaeota archaeon]